ncbi:zf-PARP-domain-containing protein, partial [Neurospora tetrasperma FGSC 2509]
EVSKNNRAGCKDSVCKKEAVKITKGELRLGTWVEINEHGGWQWRHWGCVSGEQILNMRNMLDKDGTGDYQWDMLDGWEELEEFPVLREKVQRVITQGHIDPEDFKGVSIFSHRSLVPAEVECPFANITFAHQGPRNEHTRSERHPLQKEEG